MFEDGLASCDPMALSLVEGGDRIRAFAGAGPASLIGSGGALLGDLPAVSAQVDPACVARLAGQESEPLAAPRPLYLRAPDARLPV